MRLDLRKDHIAIVPDTIQDAVYLEHLFTTTLDGPPDKYHIVASSAGHSVLLHRRAEVTSDAR